MKGFPGAAALGLSLFLVSGCAPVLVNLATGKPGVTLPQVVAHLQPVLRENKILLLGDIIFNNPTESDLKLETIHLIIEDEAGRIFKRTDLEWQEQTLLSNAEARAPLEMRLDIGALNNDSIGILVETAFTYKKFNIRVPLRSRVAVFHLRFLRENIIRPLDVGFYVKLRSGVPGKIRLDYTLETNNPVPVDLLFDKGRLRLFFEEKKDLADVALPSVLFKAGGRGRIEGSVDLKNFAGAAAVHGLLKRHGLNFQLEGEWRAPDTDIRMPWRVRATQAVEIGGK